MQVGDGCEAHTRPQPSSPRRAGPWPLEAAWEPGQPACGLRCATAPGRQAVAGRAPEGRPPLKAAAVARLPAPLWSLTLLFQNSLPSLLCPLTPEPPWDYLISFPLENLLYKQSLRCHRCDSELFRSCFLSVIVVRAGAHIRCWVFRLLGPWGGRADSRVNRCFEVSVRDVSSRERV